MAFNLASRIVLNILVGDLEALLAELLGGSVAVSPIARIDTVPVSCSCGLRLSTALHEITVGCSWEGFDPEKMKTLELFIAKSADAMNERALLWLKKNITARYDAPCALPGAEKQDFAIDLVAKNADREAMVRCFLPLPVFRLFTPQLRPEPDSAELEKEIISAFTDPCRLVPDLRAIIEVLDKRDLSLLVNGLMKNNALSVYQITLMVMALPDLALKIKGALSQNILGDVLDMKKDAPRLRINGRDLAGGIYSIEEAIYRLMKDGAIMGHDVFFRELKKAIQDAAAQELLLVKNFGAWIDEMASENLLHKTIAVMPEQTVADALGAEGTALVERFRDHVSEKKLTAIQSLAGRSGLSGVFEARAAMVRAYRNLSLSKTRPGHESLDYLLARFMRSEDYVFLLLNAGWFCLSTALKGSGTKMVRRVLSALPQGARILIEDVLKGTANPDILHDEMQVNGARERCVKEILRLQRDGFILLEG
jgi:hypothetical protein